ncbi:MAG: tRNA (guanosine(46)-N7)-methyltransferase TrmB [Prevotellaceae bacterium]|nr:tRNA (guanosine(46)-N7)-methyltransferase TrmB [Prevotellaceae bacterium]
MGKGKLAKFADMAANPLVVEYPYWRLQQQEFHLRGQWNDTFFHNANPIVLELGCGRGEYTVGLARRFPDRNFIGIDIKGARMWHGAQTAVAEGMTNVAFLRTSIEFIHHFFAPDEVSELWLTFSDPQMKKATKRLTSTHFLQRYRQFLIPDGIIHLKTDSPFLYTYTRLMAQHNHLPVEVATDDLYRERDIDSSLTDIRTYYEQMWLDRGFTIKYLRLRLPHDTALTEPDVDIPVDGYRSYNHEVRSTRTTGR